MVAARLRYEQLNLGLATSRVGPDYGISAAGFVFRATPSARGCAFQPEAAR